ncbi:hypothetical protein Tco_1000739 [Tanacetum coccineum]
MFYTSKEEIALNDFCRDQVKPLLNELLDYFDGFQNLFQRNIKEMKDAFEQNDVYLDEIERKNDLLKDQLLEASLKHDIELCVLLNHECVDKSLHDEFEQLKARMKNGENGKSVNTKFDKTHGSQSFLCVTPLNKNASQKVLTQQESQTNKTKNVLSSTRMNATSSVKRPKSRESHVKTSVLDVSKHEAKKEAVYVRKKKQTDNTFAKVMSNKENVIDVAIANASKAKTLLCVSCMQNVRIPCHDKCVAKHKLNVHSNVRRTFSVNSRLPKSSKTTFVAPKTRFSEKATQSKTVDTTSVASKSKIDEASASKARDKVVQIVLWVVDSGCSKHMTGDRSLLRNFVEKFIGFGNDNFAAITGYDDYIHGIITICHV